ncbi:uncharacterized protein Triagg1_8888 [Trichoderma aggressivum f. europaeum]|uniref:HNH nuclease domain-containing protein n=1 Tax=Trichoderma aggressivum f. europaeum TaxID=173218 RepID=A0AAE1I9D4_9HYPO|nr:hypothetical protein Triagg1_8888 [Trichoderma aggressivum f. europaeum]
MEDQLGKALASTLNEQQMKSLLHLNEYSQLGPLLNLAKERPSLILGLVENYSRAAEEPVLDYVPDIYTRIFLFGRLQDSLRRHELSFVPSMKVFALFMVAPVDVLRSRLDNLERNAREKNMAEVQEFIEQCRTAVTVILEFVSAEARQVGGFSEDNVHLLQSMDLCKKRDVRICSISRMENPEAVTIFPNAIHSPNLLSMMDTFWGTETADRLSELIRDPSFLKSPQNMLSLNRQLSWWYQSGRIAFKPLRKTDTDSLTIQFYWLKRSKLEPSQLFKYDMSIWDVMETADIANNEDFRRGIIRWGRPHCDSYSGLGMDTGHVHRLCERFEIGPPKFDILQLSSDLLRVAAICGATKPTCLADEVNGDYHDHYGGYDDGDDHYDNGWRDDGCYDDGDDHYDEDCRDDGCYNGQVDGGYDNDGMESQPDMYCDENYALLRHWGEEVGGEEVEGEEVEGQEDMEEDGFE